MKPNIFFTADHHFGHENIIKFSERPFESLEQMNEELIKRWNEKIGKDDTVYHLGDVSLGKPDFTKEILDRLNGNIHLIKGNKYYNNENNRQHINYRPRSHMLGRPTAERTGK